MQESGSKCQAVRQGEPTVTINSKWSYMLRLPQRRPHQLRLDRLSEYMSAFANLLGVENDPMFAGIKDASTGLRAKISPNRRDQVWKRIQTAKSDPSSKPARSLRQIETMLGEDHLSSAELKDAGERVIYLFQAHEQIIVSSATVRQSGEVDGIVTGLVGADDTMHLHLRDAFARDLKLVVKSEELARELLMHFRNGQIRLQVHGMWLRTEDGWIPEANRCVVESFDVLDETPASGVFAQIAAISDDGWSNEDDALATWRDLRGTH